VPLSEDEQRILQDIERGFYEQDPAFARSVTNTSLYGHAGRNCKIAAAGFVVSLAVLLLTFASVPVVGFLGFGCMVLCVAMFVKNFRRLGRAAWFHRPSDVGAQESAAGRMDSWADRLKEHFRKEE